MTGTRSIRGGLLIALALVVGITMTAVAFLYLNTSRHLGADYTALASNLVRAQYETVRLGTLANDLQRAPGPHYREQLLALLPMLENRRDTAIHGLRQSELPEERYEQLIAEFDHVNERLPELASALRAAEDKPRLPADVLELAVEIEDDLAFIYSELHQVTHAATAEQRRLMQGLTIAVISLLLMMLAFAAGLVAALIKLSGQRRKLEQMSHTDALTGLGNRRTLVSRAEQVLAQARRSRQPVSFALLDLDHFKDINDRHGHPAGDHILRTVATLLTSQVRETDTIARVGGEEFALLMPDTDTGGARELCKRIRSRLSEFPLEILGNRPGLTISIGLHTADDAAAVQFEELYERADTAMYQAKNQGRNRVVVA